MKALRLDATPAITQRRSSVALSRPTHKTLTTRPHRPLLATRAPLRQRTPSHLLTFPPTKLYAAVKDDPFDDDSEDDSDVEDKPFYDEREENELPEAQLQRQEDDLPEESEEEGAEDEKEMTDVTDRDKLAYERLIIEGADVVNSDKEMEEMERTLAAVQETYLNGTAYETSLEAPLNEIQTEFQYPAPPDYFGELVDILEQAQMKKHAEIIRQSSCRALLAVRMRWCDAEWGEVEVHGMQSRAENVKSGEVFFARVTEDYDGIDKIPLAFDNGAVAIFFEFSEDVTSVTMPDAQDSQVDDGDTPESLTSTNAEPIESDWMSSLKERGIEIEAMADLIPVIPVRHIEHCMSDLSCLFYGAPP